jgi:hypothetical protein
LKRIIIITENIRQTMHWTILTNSDGQHSGEFMMLTMDVL